MSDIKFCNECNNMMVPREDKGLRQLRFVCRGCPNTQLVDPTSEADNCIDRQNIHYEAQEETKVRSVVIEDPTLTRARDFTCEKCGHNEAVFFQLPEKASDTAMKLVFVCTNTSCKAVSYKKGAGEQ
eukprot:GDKI01003378.1.p1 GENE.GDKI01003378.1~~GDKI01003378.1.p1  ORF type:complete len:127 (-),score=31.94 GDKI01003378.1:172-552(-)